MAIIVNLDVVMEIGKLVLQNYLKSLVLQWQIFPYLKITKQKQLDSQP